MLKERIKRFYNKTVEGIEEMAAATAPIHNLRLNLSRGELVLPSRQYLDAPSWNLLSGNRKTPKLPNRIFRPAL